MPLVQLTTEGRVATLTLNRPDSLNALTPDLFAEGCEALDQVAGNRDIGVLVLAGAGRAFCAGADLKIFRSFTAEQGQEFTALADRFTRTLETMPQATIARVHGVCFTGGLEVALACDLLVASEEARFADTHAKFGIVPMWGLSQRLPRRVGLQRAREMSFTAREVSGQEAVALGLALEAVPPADLDARIQALADSILATSAKSVAIYKKMYRFSQNCFLDEGLDYERNMRYRSAPRTT